MKLLFKINYYCVIITLLFAITLVSCQTDSEKADKLRLENKFEEAAELYQKASDNGDAYSMWRLSNAYGNGDGVDWDDAKALELLKQSAYFGCEEAKCDLALAYIYDWYNIGKDITKGKKMFEDLVSTTSNSTVLSRYAQLLFFGHEPFEENQEEAIRILKKVEDKNNPFYLDMMGRVYMFGTDIIDIDVEKSVEYFSQAFYNGRRICASILENMYSDGYYELKADKKNV